MAVEKITINQTVIKGTIGNVSIKIGINHTDGNKVEMDGEYHGGYSSYDYEINTDITELTEFVNELQSVLESLQDKKRGKS